MKKENIALFFILLLAVFLRFYQVDRIPHGLYIDEASIGLNAYTILTEGKDEHGQAFPVYFKAFGDYKLPVYIYATSASMSAFGKNEFAIRFPSALFGALTILVFYYFLLKLISFNKYKNKYIKYVPITAAFFLAISSWHIHFSRGGFEAIVGLFLYLLACYLAMIFYEKKHFLYLNLTMMSFVLSAYTYNTYKVLAPLTVIIFIFYLIRLLPQHKVKLITAFFIFTLCISPLIVSSFGQAGSARFVGTSAFSEYKAEKLQERIIGYPMVYLKNFLSFYSLDFIVTKGDGNGRHQIPGMGVIYKWQLPFLIIGFVWLLKQKRSSLKYGILSLLIVSPLIPAVAAPSPHTLRSLLMVIPFVTLIALGVVVSIHLLKRYKVILILITSILVIYEFTLYVHAYYNHYPNVNALDWGGSCRETALKASKYKKEYPKIVIDRNLSSAKVYFDFYTPNLNPEYLDINLQTRKNWQHKKVLIIRPDYKKESEFLKEIDRVYLPGPMKPTFTIFFKQ